MSSQKSKKYSFFSKNLAFARKKAGFTQANLAKELGMNKDTLSLYERGESQPTIGVLISMVDVLGVSADDLLSKDTPTYENRSQLKSNKNQHDIGEILHDMPTVTHDSNCDQGVTVKKTNSGDIATHSLPPHSTQGNASPSAEQPMEDMKAVPVFEFDGTPEDFARDFSKFKHLCEPRVVKKEDLLNLDMLDDSMAPAMPKRAKVLIDKTNHQLLQSGVYAFKVGRLFFIARLRLVSDDLIQVISDNPKYPPYSLATKEIQIIGKAEKSVNIVI